MHVDSAKARMGVPRLFLIEAEFALEQARSELRWVRKTIDEINDGTLAWPDYVLQAQTPAGGALEPEPAATDATESRNGRGEKGGGSVE